MTLKVVLSLLLLVAGGAKLASAKPLAAQFREFGLPIPLMYLVGALEVAAAIGIQITWLALPACAGVVALMLGALASHIRVRHPPKQVGPALLVLTLAIAIAALSWESSHFAASISEVSSAPTDASQSLSLTNPSESDAT